MIGRATMSLIVAGENVALLGRYGYDGPCHYKAYNGPGYHTASRVTISVLIVAHELNGVFHSFFSRFAQSYSRSNKLIS